MPLRHGGAFVRERSKAGLRRLLGPSYYRRFPQAHRDAVGGLWDEVGALQLRFLMEQGLRPEHTLLDVGCGAVRAGVHFVRYLEPGGYHGVDAAPEMIAAARVELERHGLSDRAADVRCDADFGFDAFGERFDYAIAHSVFTHLPINSILVCLLRMDRVLIPGGRFFATFFENPNGTRRLDVLAHPRVDGAPLTSYPDRDPYHYGVDLFEWLCEGTRLRVDYVGDWGHPRSQRMLRFTAAAG